MGNQANARKTEGLDMRETENFNLYRQKKIEYETFRLVGFAPVLSSSNSRSQNSNEKKSENTRNPIPT